MRSAFFLCLSSFLHLPKYGWIHTDEIVRSVAAHSLGFWVAQIYKVHPPKLLPKQIYTIYFHAPPMPPTPYKDPQVWFKLELEVYFASYWAYIARRIHRELVRRTCMYLIMNLHVSQFLNTRDTKLDTSFRAIVCIPWAQVLCIVCHLWTSYGWKRCQDRMLAPWLCAHIW